MTWLQIVALLSWRPIAGVAGWTEPSLAAYKTHTAGMTDLLLGAQILPRCFPNDCKGTSALLLNRLRTERSSANQRRLRGPSAVVAMAHPTCSGSGLELLQDRPDGGDVAVAL